MSNSFWDRGGLWVIAQSFLMIVVVALGLIFHGQWPRWATHRVGQLLLVLGAVIGIAGALVLGRNRTPFPKPRDDSRLVQTGIYGLVRHPLYASLIFVSFGWGLIRQSWPALAAAVSLAIFFNAKALREERWLREKFPEYATYEQRVRRFVPWIY